MSSVLNRLVIYAIGTGLLTSIFALFTVIFFIIPHTFIGAAILYVGVKIHVNSLLVSLNSRRMMSRQLANGPVTTIALSRSSLPQSGIRVDQSISHRTDGVSKGPLTFKPTDTVYTAPGIVHDDIEMQKPADPL
jgi:hypothetical protein